ncbi:MAG: sulfatase-like hydrolase/transferase, partial [Thermoanaerobaculia bacterium]|nr:sulfatase-like hydrolase/transferase [Thermoanaerobaculia bacterium]
ECPHTSCSVAGLLTGRAMVSYSPPSGPVAEETARLARRLQDAGYYTAAVAANPNLSVRRDLHLGFDSFVEARGQTRMPRPAEPRARALRRLFHRVTQADPGLRERRLDTIGAWLQGEFGVGHELLDVEPESRLAAALPSIREELRDGLRSESPSDEAIMDALRRAVARVTRQPPELVIEETRRVTDRALDLLEEASGDRPLFLLVHMVPPHEPYVPAPSTSFHDPDYEGPVEVGLLHVRALAGLEETLDPDDVAQLSALYDGNFRRGDEELGRLLSALRGRPRWDRTAVVVTSDHGEAFLEHGEISHGNNIFEEEVRIPLVIRPPSDVDSPVVREELASLLDLYPTLLALADLPRDPGAWGEDLLAPGFDGFRILFLRYPRGFGAVAGDWKLVVDLKEQAVPRLFHLRRDPREERNVAREHPARVAVLTALLKRFLSMRELSPVPEASGEMSPEERRRLEALGYLG